MIMYRYQRIFIVKKNLKFISPIYIFPYSNWNRLCHKVSVKKKRKRTQDNCFRTDGETNARLECSSLVNQVRISIRGIDEGIDAALSYIRAQMSECSSSLFLPSLLLFFFFQSTRKEKSFHGRRREAETWSGLTWPGSIWLAEHWSRIGGGKETWHVPRTKKNEAF